MNEKDAQVTALVEIIETCCVELKKDNSIAARRKQAKAQREKMKAVLGIQPADTGRKFWEEVLGEPI